ncbi:MAG TPA: outer membrane beta-barrel protein [Nitrosomonas sp.]|nr:outer membrane beta-barrel protein [Nitrosomonas sp.]
MRIKAVFSLMMCVLFANQTPAQIIRSFGVKVAYTSAELVYDDVEWNQNTDRRSGVNAAIFVEWLNVPFISVVTQAEYAQRGRSISFYVIEPGTFHESLYQKVSDRLDYLSIPIMGKFRVPFGFFSPFVAAGPRVDFLLGQQSDDGLFDQYIKKTNIGATLSLGGEVKTPLPFTLALEARYNVDLANARSMDYTKVHNNSFDAWLGIGF